MITLIIGTIYQVEEASITVLAHGIGYEVFVANPAAFAAQLNTEITLHIHFVVREDCQLLFGFNTQDERFLFRILLKVNGVGPKMALNLLSIGSLELITAIKSNKSSRLTLVSGVGKKTAERIVLEVQDKLKNWSVQDLTTAVNTPKQDALDALMALGYKINDAKGAVEKAYQDEISCEDLIKSALQYLA